METPTIGEVAVARRLRVPRRSRLDGLFPIDVRRPVGPRAVVMGLAAVVAGAIVSLGHEDGGVDVLNTIWAEDGTYYLSDALGRGFLAAVLNAPQGYFVIGPRLLAEVASVVPVAWGPAVLTAEAATVTGLMALAVYVASGTHLRHWLAQLVAAVPVVAVPVGENIAATTANNVATLQFAAVYTTLWMLLWVPARRAGRVTTVAVVLTTSLSTFLSVLLLPLAMVRLVVRRDGTSGAMVGVLVVGAGLNIAALALRYTARPDIGLESRYDPVWAVGSAARYALPNAVFGYRPAAGVGPGWFSVPTLMVAAAVIIAVVVLVGLLRITGPAWWVAIVLAVHAVVLFCAAIMSLGGLELRYVVAPELMLFAAMAAVLLPRAPGWRGLIPLAALATFVMAVSSLSYRLESGRSDAHPWDQLVGRARAACSDPGHGAVNVYPNWDGRVVPVPAGDPMPRRPGYAWPVRIPCDRLR